MKNSHYTIYIFLFLAIQCLFHQSRLLGVTTDTTSSKSRYSCPVESCDNNKNKGFANQKYLENHLLNQHTKCPLCISLRFASKKDLHEHTKDKHPIDTYCCTTCNKFITNNKRYYKKHEEICSPELKQTQSCPIKDCLNNKNRGFTKSEHLRAHLLTKHRMCPDCNASAFHSKEELLDHIINNHPIKTFPSELCNKYTTEALQCPIENCDNNKGEGFAKQVSLENHLLTQHTKCRLCTSLTFDSKKDLHEHIKNKHPKKIYYCAKCKDFISNNKGSYEKHQKTCNPKLNQTLPCPIEDCHNNKNKGFTELLRLQNHLMSQHAICQLCLSLTFDSKEDLHLHMKDKHPQKKIYYCSMCKQYITNEKNHYRKHKTACNKRSQTKTITPSKRTNRLDASTNNIQNTLKHFEDNLNFSEIDFLNSPCSTALDEAFFDTIEKHPDLHEIFNQTDQTEITLNNDNIFSDKHNLPCPIENCRNNNNKGFNTSASLSAHLLNQHTKCPECISLIFNSKEDLYNHFQDAHFNKKIYCCLTCNDYITNSKTDYNKHQQKHSELLKQSLPCPIESCDNNKGRGFTRSQHLNEHLVNQHTKCPKCISLIFNSKEDLHTHMINSHPKQTIYYCLTCNDFITNQGTNYNQHQATHNKQSQMAILRPGKRKNRSNDSANNPQIKRRHTKAEIDFLDNQCLTGQNEYLFDTIQTNSNLHEIFNHTDQTQITLNDDNIFSDNILDILSLDLLEQSMAMRSAPNAGIINENGTDCFMSATLQVLSSIPAFEKFFMENAFNKNSHTGSLINFLNKLRTEQSAISGSKDLRQRLTTHPELSSMASGQHDAQEFLIKLISLLDDDVNNTVGSVHKLKNIFGINLAYNLTCNNCHQSKHNTQIETLLALGIPDQLSTITLQALLNNLLNQPEFVSDYTCEACQAPGITRTTAIKKLPDILMLSANRFGYENDQAYRINTPIFPEKNITLRDENGISSYKIMGIIAQQGTLQHGHYTAYVQDSFDGTWYLYDDSQRIDVLRDYDDKDDITTVVNSSSAYIFFYKRVHQ